MKRCKWKKRVKNSKVRQEGDGALMLVRPIAVRCSLPSRQATGRASRQYGGRKRTMDAISEALGMTEAEYNEAKHLRDHGDPMLTAQVMEAAHKGHENQLHELETNPYARDPYEEQRKKERRRARVEKAKEKGERAWTERDVQSAFNAYAERVGKTTACFELKASTGTSLPWDALQPHQEAALMKAKHGALYHRLSDHANSLGLKERQPFDSFIIAGAKSFVVVMFNVKHIGNRVVHLIDIDDWIRERERSDRKSLTMDRAKVIGKEVTI